MAPGSRKGTVLVVAEERGLRNMLSILFKRDGFDVTFAPGFQAGREAVVGSPSPYGMVLTDLLMPDGSGLDLLTVARQRSTQTEVIVMTAHSTLETAIEAMKRGAYDFITKPFANSELRALVDKAFEKRALLAEDGAGPRGERPGEGAHRACDPRAVGPEGQAVSRRQLRRDPRDVDRER